MGVAAMAGRGAGRSADTVGLVGGAGHSTQPATSVATCREARIHQGSPARGPVDPWTSWNWARGVSMTHPAHGRTARRQRGAGRCFRERGGPELECAAMSILIEASGAICCAVCFIGAIGSAHAVAVPSPAAETLDESALALVPLPERVMRKPGTFSLTASARISAPARLRGVAERFRDD